jgi:hypothetical protein
MQILFLIFAIIAVVLGFVGLITIIKGFVDKSSKKVWLGTILVCIMLILGVCGGFCIARRALDSKRYHEDKREMMAKKCGKKCNFDFLKSCCSGDSTIMGDSSEVQVIVKKNCIKKGDGNCPHHMN